MTSDATPQAGDQVRERADGQVRPRGGRQATGRSSPLQRASLATLIMLIVQYALGIGVNLYVSIPSVPGHSNSLGKAFTTGPALAVHTALGLLLILAAIGALVQAIRARYPAVIVTSAIGLAAILAAAGSGAGFVRSGADASSMGMAMATAVAMLCYAAGLHVLSRPRRG